MYTESKKITNREKVTLVTLNDLIPENHIVRKLEKLLDLIFIYPLIEDTKLIKQIMSQAA